MSESHYPNTSQELSTSSAIRSYDDQDITGRKNAEEQRLASEKRFQAMIEGSSDTFVLVDGQGDVLYVSPANTRLLGYASEEIVHHNSFEFQHPDDIEITQKRFAELLLEPGRIVTAEYRLRHKDGTWRWMEGVGRNFLDDPDIQGIIINARDITERKQMEQRKDDFISMVSHELKTPLTGLLAYTELLHNFLERENNTRAIHYLSRMDIQLTKLTRLIADLLDVVRGQESKLAFAEEPVMMDELVHEVIEYFQPTAPSHRILIEGEVPCEIIGDRDRLSQVILNLLGNAVKYSPRAEQVIMRMAHTSDAVTISVQDFGIGIAAPHQERIFERFYRVTSDQKQGFPGLGIGLYLCHEFIRHHGGRVWVDSIEGHGSTFSFALPLKQK